MRDHGRVSKLRASAVVAVSAAATVLLFPAAGARAASCKVVTVQNTVTTGTGLSLQPSQLTIPYGGCVTFTNKSIATVTITVEPHYSQDVAAGASTSGRTNYVGTTPGGHKAKATTGPTFGTGNITVNASPSPPPSPSRSQASSPPPQHTPPPQPTSSGTGPQVAPTPSFSPPVVGVGVPPPGQQPPPSIAAAGSPTPTSSPTPAPAATAVVAGPLEPGSGRGVGLPAALAALAVAGTGAALVRVLLAEPYGPVDDGRTVRSSA
jgi:hypothetical protein